MDSDDRRPSAPGDEVVELARVQPIEAEVIAARLRASGIPAIVGADSVYPSLSVADGVPVFVPAKHLASAKALLGRDEGAER